MALLQLHVLGLHVVTSGSMVPTLQVGDVVLTRTVPADTLRAGQIATLRRDDGALVTHRVTATAPGSSTAERLVTMRGDANETADRTPYRATSGQVLLLRLPALGGILRQLSAPPYSVAFAASLVLLAVGSLLPRRTEDTDA